LIDYDKEKRHLGMKKLVFDRTLYAIIAVIISPLFKIPVLLVMTPTILAVLTVIALIIFREWKFESDRLGRYERSRRYEHT